MRYVNLCIDGEIIFSKIGSGVELQDEFIFKLKDDTTAVYKLLNIKYHNSEYQIPGHFHIVIYDILIDCWRNCDKERNSVVIPEDVYYILSTVKVLIKIKPTKKENMQRESIYMYGFTYANNNALNQYACNE